MAKVSSAGNLPSEVRDVIASYARTRIRMVTLTALASSMLFTQHPKDVKKTLKSYAYCALSSSIPMLFDVISSFL